MARIHVVSSKLVRRTPIFEIRREKAAGPGNFRIDREIIHHPGAAVMLARNPAGEVLLVRQFRLPARRFFWELPAGRLDRGETPLQAAKRELKEETGYRARRWKKIFGFYSSPGFCDEYMTVFLAEDLTEGESSPEPYEQIEKRWYTWAEAIRMVKTRGMQDAKTIAALLHVNQFGP